MQGDSIPPRRNAGLPVAVMALAASLLAIVPPVAAHGAAPPLPYMVRLLSDHSDDWLGVQDGHNLIALDGYVAYNATFGGLTLVLRLVMDGGYARTGLSTPTLSDHVTFKAGATPYEFAFETSDNHEFSGTFPAVRGPGTQNTADGAADGTRFWVEGLVPLRSLGVAPGDALGDFFVQGEADEQPADAMPEGVVPGTDDPMGVASNIGTWRLPDTTVLAEATGPSEIRLADGATTAHFTFTNRVQGVPQTFRILAQASGATVSGDLGSFDIPGEGTLTRTLTLTPATPRLANGTAGEATNGTRQAAMEMGALVLSWDSSLGGHGDLHSRLQLPLPPPPTMEPAPATTSKKAPVPPVLLLLAILAVARARTPSCKPL